MSELYFLFMVTKVVLYNTSRPTDSFGPIFANIQRTNISCYLDILHLVLECCISVFKILRNSRSNLLITD